MKKILLLILCSISLVFGQVTSGYIFEIDAANYDGTDVTNTGSLGSVRNGHEEGTVTIGNAGLDSVHMSFTGATANHIRSNTTEATPSLLITTGTFEACIRIDDLSVFGAPFAIADTGHAQWYFLFQINTDSSVLMNLRRLSQQYLIYSPTSALITATWYHIIWQIDNTLTSPMRMYINGISQTLTKNTTTDTTDITEMVAGDEARMKYSVGGIIDTTPLGFKGDVGFVRLYNTYLTPAQVATNYLEFTYDYLGVTRPSEDGGFKRFKGFPKWGGYK